MTVANIVTLGRSMANLQNVTFYTTPDVSASSFNDGAMSIQTCWYEMYDRIMENNDDYFVVTQYLPTSGTINLGASTTIVTGAGGTATVGGPTIVGVFPGSQFYFYSPNGVLRSTTLATVTAIAYSNVTGLYTLTFNSIPGAAVSLDSLYLYTPAFIADANRQYTFLVDLNILNPAFWRIRNLQFRGMNGGQYYPAGKMTGLDFGSASNSPAYYLSASNLYIYDPQSYSQYAIWYYPKPVDLYSLASGSVGSAQNIYDFNYPNNLIHEILALQVAIDIRRKQKQEAQLWEQRQAQMKDTFIHQIKRDDFRAYKIKNSFNDGFNFWR